MLITIKNLYKKHADRTIIKDGQLIINDQDKIGIVGKNGVGKSTLLKIIAKIENMDKGEYITGGNIKISYLEQMSEFHEPISCFDYIYRSIDKKENVQEYQIKSILSKLGIQDSSILVTELSGGQKKRVALAKALLLPSDLLLLDEPTNHLDIDMINWLQKYLVKYKGAIVMVTHDRYFLENVCNKMIELDHQELFTYQANYSLYLEQKEERVKALQAADHKRQQFLKKEIEWVRAGVQARSTKSKSRLERFETLSKQENYSTDKNLELAMIASRLGSKTIDIDHLSYKIQDRYLIQDFSYHFLRYDRVGIIGNNGVGKSTLLNLICQQLQPTSGTISIGDTVKIGYFSQTIQNIDESKRVIDVIKEYATTFNLETKDLTATMLLEQFLFDKEKQYTYVHKLSGGEKRRLFLLTILLNKPNVLILDEPTNDFDMATLNILENFLDDFLGIVIVVSHDRYFLDRVVDKIFAFEDTHLVMYNGGYSDYYQKQEEKQTIKKTITTPKVNKQDKIKMTYLEKKEFETIEDKISTIEKQMKENDEAMNQYSDDYQKVIELSSKQSSLEQELETLMERWEYLSELNEKIMQQS